MRKIHHLIIFLLAALNARCQSSTAEQRHSTVPVSSSKNLIVKFRDPDDTNATIEMDLIKFIEYGKKSMVSIKDPSKLPKQLVMMLGVSGTGKSIF